MSEAQVPGQGEWRKTQIETSPDFHLENKVDEVEKLIERVGWDRAFQQIEENFDSSPDDPENRRKLTLIIKLDDERKARLRTKLNH